MPVGNTFGNAGTAPRGRPLGSQYLRFERGGFGGGGIAVASCDNDAGIDCVSDW